jgi:DNA-binding response OmpR family regulator
LKKKIVIIEDNQVLTSVYQSKLTMEGYDVEVAADGERGLEMVMKAAPDTVRAALSP